MIAPEFIAKFIAEHGLTDLTLARDGFEYEAINQAAKAAAWAADHTPPRFADACPTHSDVQAWTAAVLQASKHALERHPIAAVNAGPSLLLLGNTGTGKTHQAYGAVRLLSAIGLNVRWQVISAADLYARLRPRHQIDSESEFRAIADAKTLVLDDLGAAKTSEWVEEINFRLINHRYEQQLPTVFTSNTLPKDLGAELGERVASRLTEMTTRVVMTGTDRRRAA